MARRRAVSRGTVGKVTACTKIPAVKSWALTSLATALAKAGRDAEVRAIDAELRERAAGGWVPPLILAVMACMTGDFTRGATELVRSMQERDFWLPCVYLDNELVQLFSRDPVIVGIWKQSGLPFPV